MKITLLGDDAIRLERVAALCTVHATLMHPTEVDIVASSEHHRDSASA